MKSLLKSDNILALAVFLLLIFGLVMITSIGVPKSIQISAPGVLYPSCSDPNVDCYLLFKKHLVRLLIGIGAFFLAFYLPVKFWKKTALIFFFSMVIFLFFISVFGHTYGTFAKSWIVIRGMSLQPTEFGKLALIIYLAKFFENKKSVISDFKDGFLPFVVISALIAIPVLIQPDLGSTLVIAMIAVAIYFVAGANPKHLLISLGVGLFLSVILIATIPHVNERFTSFTRTDEECIEDACWQSRQANIAVGSGGWFGKGLTQGMQKSYWLPQATDDFIFAASAEELGFLRIVLVIIAFFIIAKRGISIANNANSNFEILLATGLTTWITMQAFINIAVNIALMPVTGLTLPFVSYGGSSLISSMLAVGILLSISAENKNYANSLFGRRDVGAHRSKPVRYRRF